VTTLASVLARLEKLERAVARLDPEIESEAVRARLRDRLETMAQRFRESPDWRELTPAELAEVRAMMARHRAGGAEQN
jgi:hypothetical protein